MPSAPFTEVISTFSQRRVLRSQLPGGGLKLALLPKKTRGETAQVELRLLEVGRAELLAAAGLVDLARVDRHELPGVLEAAHAGPHERGVQAKPQRIAGGRA